MEGEHPAARPRQKPGAAPQLWHRAQRAAALVPAESESPRSPAVTGPPPYLRVRVKKQKTKKEKNLSSLNWLRDGGRCCESARYAARNGTQAGSTFGDEQVGGTRRTVNGTHGDPHTAITSGVQPTEG